MIKYISPLFFILFILFLHVGAATESTQRPATDANIFGHVINAETGEHIPFINLIVENTRIGTITDVSGHYILTNLPVGRHRLIIQGMGYETVFREFEAIARESIEVDVEVRPTAIRLDEVVFTSSPTQSGFRYQPDQIFLSEDLQRRAEASFGEMLNTEPGISMRSMGSMPSRPVIRGLDGDRILILQNGERMGDISETSADHSISLDPLAASRVEVVRGPASLLYGSSALGGVINLMTTDIPDDPDRGTSGVLSFQGATVNDMGAGFGRITHSNGSLSGSARFSYRQAGDVKTPEGVLYGTSMQNYDGAAGIGFIRPDRNGGISLSMTGQTYEIPEAIDDPEETVEIRMQRIGMHGRLNLQRQGFFDKGQVRFNASRMQQGEYEMERENGQWEEELDLEYTKLTFSSTATMQHKPFRMLDRGAVGLNLYAHSMDVGGDEAYTPGEDRINLGVFTFQELPLTNLFRFQAGLRIDLQYTAARANHVFRQIESSRTAVNYSGSVGFNHRPRQGIEVGGQFARSHRNPSVEELYADGAHLGAGVYEIGNATLKDEVGHGADFFIRFENQSIELELATFINHFLNFIIFQPEGRVDDASGFPVFAYEGDEARLMGGEVRVSYTPAERVRLNAGIDYVEGKRLADGRQNLPFMPPLRFTGGMEYDFGKVWTGLRMQSVSKQDRVAPEEESTPGYTLLGAQIGFRADGSGRHVIILRADNLLDTAYRDHLSRIEDRNFPMPGRNFNLTYRWFF
jgi:iron complex outermembrane recepter protein